MPSPSFCSKSFRFDGDATSDTVRIVVVTTASGVGERGAIGIVGVGVGGMGGARVG